MVIVLVAVAAITALRIAKMIIEGIVTPVDELKYAAAEMTQGRLDAEINYESADELGELADSIREVQEALGAYVREISDTLEVIATGDLTKNFKEITDFRGEFGSIKDSFVRILKEFNKQDYNFLSEEYKALLKANGIDVKTGEHIKNQLKEEIKLKCEEKYDKLFTLTEITEGYKQSLKK